MKHPPETPRSSSSARSIAQSISARFEEQVAGNRDRLAIGAANRSLSYGALNEAANRVARAVLATAPHTDAVAVLIGHGASIIVAMLGVLKAGKIFVSLDTRQPPARMLQILDDCEAQLLITDEQSLPDAGALLRPGFPQINVDALVPALSSDDLGLSIRGEAPACLLYTSGSTGSPKGVVQTHGNLLHKTKALTDVLQVGQQDRLASLATCSVGFGMSSALLALLNGASLHPFDLRELGLGELARWLFAHEISVLSSTPSAFRHFSKTLTARDEFPALRAIRLAGEQIFPHDFELYRQHFPQGCVLVGGFASTETGPVTTYVMDHDSDITDSVPAGYPLDGTTVIILDDTGDVRPAGELGEIAVQSRFLSPGYWRDPDRTAAAFVDVPSAAGERLYRTGDLGTLGPDGCLEHRGRKDFRVKIRGFRVELEEIERSLCNHPLVLEAAVIASPDSTGVNRLTAYVVSPEGRSPTVNDLRAHLISTLPEQMVPAAFNFLPTLPRTASGKVHRVALSAPLATTSAIPVVDRPPLDALEVYLTNLWEDLLDQRPIGVTANFFELGGHSLLAARLSASIERTFGTKLPLATFFKAATIEQQAHLLRERPAQKEWPSLVPIHASGSKPPLFCVHLVDGNVLSYRDLARHLPPDQPLYGLQSRGLDGVSRINSRIEDMASDYVSEVRRSHPGGPYAICGWSFGGLVAFEMARQLELAGQSVALVAMFDTHVPGKLHIGGPGSQPRRPALARATTLLLRGRDRLQTIGSLFEARLWRMLVLWHRHGGWLPRALQKVTHANRNALRDYVPQPYGGRVMLFKAAQHLSQRPRDLLFGWGPVAAGGVEIHEAPGHHLDMVFEPHARTLAEKLTRCLDKAWAVADTSARRPTRAGRGDDRAA